MTVTSIRYKTLAGSTLPNTSLYNFLLVLGFALITAIAAQVRIPLPFTPVPITGQTLAVLLAGGTLGTRLGIHSQLLYLAMGIAGAPVFADASAGYTVLLGPTGGYLIGFLVAVALVGFLSEKAWDRRLRTSLLQFLAGNLAIYAIGVPWLKTVLGVGWSKAFALGLWPFLTGDLTKIVLAGVLLPGLWHLRRNDSDSQ